MKMFFTYKSKGSIDTSDKLEKINNFLEKKGELLSKDLRLKNFKPSGEKMNDKDILDRSLNLIKECDVFIADVSFPSLGVGYQINFAKNLNKKIICLYEVQVKQELSPIINRDNYIHLIKYKDLEEMFIQLELYFKRL